MSNARSAMAPWRASYFLDRLALQPRRSARIQWLDLAPLQARPVALDRVADAGLQISEVPVARWELLEERFVQNGSCTRRNGVHAVFLIDRLAQHDAPAALPFFEEIVEPPGAKHVAQHTLDLRALRDRHLGLRNGAVSGEVDRDAAEEMQDADTLGPGLLADFDKLVAGALRPGRHHAAVRVPDRAKTLPVSGIAPDRPVLQQFPDQAVIFDLGVTSGHADVSLGICFSNADEAYPHRRSLPSRANRGVGRGRPPSHKLCANEQRTQGVGRL